MLGHEPIQRFCGLPKLGRVMSPWSQCVAGNGHADADMLRGILLEIPEPNEVASVGSDIEAAAMEKEEHVFGVPGANPVDSKTTFKLLRVNLYRMTTA